MVLLSPVATAHPSSPPPPRRAARNSSLPPTIVHPSSAPPPRRAAREGRGGDDVVDGREKEERKGKGKAPTTADRGSAWMHGNQLWQLKRDRCLTKRELHSFGFRPAIRDEIHALIATRELSARIRSYQPPSTPEWRSRGLPFPPSPVFRCYSFRLLRAG